MTGKPIEEMSLEELRAELQNSPLNQALFQREKEAEQERSRERRARYDRINHELDVKYSAQAGVTIDRWQELKDVFTDYRDEWDLNFS